MAAGQQHPQAGALLCVPQLLASQEPQGTGIAAWHGQKDEASCEVPLGFAVGFYLRLSCSLFLSLLFISWSVCFDAFVFSFCRELNSFIA